MVGTEQTKLLTNFRNSVVHVEPTARWVRGVFAGVTVIDSKRAVLLRSTGGRRGLPMYYFPAEDVRMDLLKTNGRIENDRHIGEATYYNITANGRTAEDAAWSFGETLAKSPELAESDAPNLRGYVAFSWEKMDSWFEEADEVFKHARDPYKRIDCIPSSRHVRVVLDGETVAETDRPVLLFETGCPLAITYRK